MYHLVLLLVVVGTATATTTTTSTDPTTTLNLFTTEAPIANSTCSSQDGTCVAKGNPTVCPADKIMLETTYPCQDTSKECCVSAGGRMLVETCEEQEGTCHVQGTNCTELMNTHIDEFTCEDVSDVCCAPDSPAESEEEPEGEAEGESGSTTECPDAWAEDDGEESGGEPEGEPEGDSESSTAEPEGEPDSGDGRMVDDNSLDYIDSQESEEETVEEQDPCVLPDMILENGTIGVVENCSSIVECQSICLKTDDCFSLSFVPIVQLCLLKNESHDAPTELTGAISAPVVCVKGIEYWRDQEVARAGIDDEGSWFFIQLASGLVIEFPPVINGKYLTINTKHGGDLQLFKWDNQGRLENKKTGMVIDIAGNSRRHGAKVVAWSKKQADNQYWQLRGKYLYSKLNGMVLEVRGSYNTPGSVLQVARFNDHINQQWRLVEASKGGKFVSIGCWRDVPNRRAIPTIENTQLGEGFLDGHYRNREEAILKCYKAAKKMGVQVFAVQNGGWCASSANAGETYKRWGPSNKCGPDGKGGHDANEVYRIQSSGPERIVSTAEFGFIKSTNYPAKYNSKESVVYEIKTNCRSLELEFKEVKLETEYDFLTIYQGDKLSKSKIVRIVTGHTIQTPEVIHGGSALLWFISDEAMENRGFKIQYRGRDCRDPTDRLCPNKLHVCENDLKKSSDLLVKCQQDNKWLTDENKKKSGGNTESDLLKEENKWLREQLTFCRQQSSFSG